MSNEGILQLSEIQQLNYQSKVMIWRGKGGRRLLIAELEQRGVQVDVIEWYARQLPKKSLQIYQNWLSDTFVKKDTNKKLNNQQVTDKPLTSQLATVLISSGEAFENWQLIVDAYKSTNISNFEPKHQTSLKDFNYIVLGERLAKLLSKYSLNYQKVDDLSVESIRQVLFV